jgi:hypothetical protein
MTSRSAALVVGLLAAVTLGFRAAGGTAAARAESEWRSFQGSWSATGRRETVPVDRDRVAATVRLSGAVVLTASGGLTSGFRGEAIGFDDGQSRGAGRAVWTDARGDRIFSAIVVEPLGTGRSVSGTITGGTGRYNGISGDYSLTWQYVVAADDNAVQGRSVDLAGRFRLGDSDK